MGIRNIQVLFEEEGTMNEETQGGDSSEEPRKDESASPPVGVDPNHPVEQNDELKDESPSPPRPVDNPDLPEEGDPDDVEEEPVPDSEFDQYADNNDTMDNREEAEEPNDLSGIDKEFDDDEDGPGSE
jgi:hypothetical protein